MRAIVVDRWMEPRDLRVAEIPAPALKPAASSSRRGCRLQFFDVLMMQGKYQVKPPFRSCRERKWPASCAASERE